MLNYFLPGLLISHDLASCMPLVYTPCSLNALRTRVICVPYLQAFKCDKFTKQCLKFKYTKLLVKIYLKFSLLFIFISSSFSFSQIDYSNGYLSYIIIVIIICIIIINVSQISLKAVDMTN